MEIGSPKDEKLKILQNPNVNQTWVSKKRRTIGKFSRSMGDTVHRKRDLKAGLHNTSYHISIHGKEVGHLHSRIPQGLEGGDHQCHPGPAPSPCPPSPSLLYRILPPVLESCPYLAPPHVSPIILLQQHDFHHQESSHRKHNWQDKL
jgi:hypothetical protein